MSFSQSVREELLELKMWDNNSNLEQDEQLARLIIREAFIKRGFVNNPNKDYHFEILFKTKKKALELQEILRNFGIDMKITKKAEEYMLYLKDGEAISSVLALMGASKSMLKFEEVKKIKEKKRI